MSETRRLGAYQHDCQWLLPPDSELPRAYGCCGNAAADDDDNLRQALSIEKKAYVQLADTASICIHHEKDPLSPWPLVE